MQSTKHRSLFTSLAIGTFCAPGMFAAAGADLPVARNDVGAAHITEAQRWQNSPITPQDFDPDAGSGGDDSVALNVAAAAASAKAGIEGGKLYLPPPRSGFYNVCADSFRPQKVANGISSLVISGASAGGVTIRALPGCNNPSVRFSTLFIEGQAFKEQVKSQTKLAFENVRIDGSCVSRYTVYNVFSVGLTFRNSVIRNAAPGNGADYYQRSGYETSIDNSNRLENVNDADHPCYGNAEQLPDYNLWVSGTDNQFGTVAVNARIANFYADHGGNNHFIGAHGWGYPGGTDDQPNLRPKYNFLLEGNQVLIGTVGDQPTVASIRLQNTVTDNTGAIITAHTVTGPLEPQVQGISIGHGVLNSLIYGNNLASVSKSNAIVSDGDISPSNSIFYNSGSNNGEQWQSYEPRLSCGSGDLGKATGVSGRYQTIGKTVFVYFSANIAANGSCKQAAEFTLPFPALANSQISGFAYNGSYKQTMAVIGVGSSKGTILKYDGTYPGADGTLLIVNGSYEAQ